MQKTIGILGGMSWPSTADYYRLLNEGINARLGQNHCAEVVCASVDFQVIEDCQFSGGWDQAGEILAERARRIETAGADFLLIASNTMHRLADVISAQISIPLLHIADTAAQALRQKAVSRVGLLGTLFTMEHPFYRHRLESHGLEVLVPPSAARQIINKFTYEQLVKGRFTDEARTAFTKAISDLSVAGAEAVLLACTEFPILLRDHPTAVPIFDTSLLHCAAAVDYALS